MRCRTSLNANQARLKRGKEPQYVGSPQPLTNDNSALVVDTVSLKDVLCDIEANPDRGQGDLSSEQQCCPADPIRTWLGRSGGRPPHLDSNHQSPHERRAAFSSRESQLFRQREINRRRHEPLSKP